MKKFIKQISTVFLIQILISVTNVILLYFISSSYGVIEYGDYYLVKKVANTVSLILLIGLTVSIPRYYAYYKKKHNENIIKIIVLVTPLIGIFFFLIVSSYIFPFILGDLHERYGLIIIAISISFVIFLTLNSYQRAIENFKGLSLYSFMNYALIPIVVFFIVDGFYRYMLFYSISLLAFNLIVYLLFLYRFTSTRLFSDIRILQFTEYKPVLKFAIFRFPGLVLASVIFTLPIFVLNYFGMDYEKGILSQLFQLFPIVIMPINAIGTVLLPRLSNIIVNKGIDSVINEIHKFSVLFLAITTLIVTIIYFCMDIYYLSLNGEPVKESFSFVYYLVIALIPYSYYTLFRNPIDAASDKSFTTIIIFISFVFGIVSFVLIYILSELSIALNVIISLSILLFLLGLISYYCMGKLYRRIT